jgi:polysaccharide export outer membrane protein
MKKPILFTLISILAFNSSDLYSQDIDLSILKNLSPQQMEAAKKELGTNIDLEDAKPEVIESTIEIEPDDEQLDDGTIKKYGYNFFTSLPTSVAAVGDLPLPGDYIISLVDQFTVILSGSKQAIFDLNVKLDGTVLFPELGSILVVGETFNEVKEKLRNLVKQSYIGVNLDLSIKNLAAKKITIVGAVNTPGTYLVNPFSTISSALAYSGGVSEIGTLRNIKLIRNNSQIFYFDLYKLLIYGDRSEDINIQAGDVILVNPALQFIELDGQINRPAIYEIKEGETFEDLINYGAGFTNIANKTNIDYKFLDIKSASIKLLNNTDMSSSLKNILSVKVNQYKNKNTSSIQVYGSVKEPGHYELLKNETLKDFIARLEFIDVYPWFAVLEQFDDKNLVRQSVLLSLNDPNTYQSINMTPNSKLFFFNIDEISLFKKYDFEEDNFEEDNFEDSINLTPSEYSENHNLELNSISKKLINDFTLKINHMNKSYNLPVFGNFQLKSLVEFIGLDMSNVDENVTYISPLQDLISEGNYKNININASKFNTVTFRSPVNDLINVKISGAIDYPGTYTIKSNATLSDLYSYVGKFKKEAFNDGIILTRESVRNRQIEALEKSKNQINEFLFMQSQESSSMVNINAIKMLSESIKTENLGRLSGNFSPDSQSLNQMILRDGDSIIVPVISNTISVLGEVQNEITFEFTSGMNASSAIKIAGGFNELSNKRQIYIIKANGLTVKANSFLIGNPKLEAGDTIIVPRKLITENALIKALQPVTRIISDLAFSAAALESLSNAN